MVLEQLKEIRSLIEKPENWIQKFYAADINGVQVDIRNPTACKFCLSGAIQKITGNISSHTYMLIDKYIYKNNIAHSIPAFNDTESHEKVIGLLDNLIKQSETQNELCLT